MVVVYIEDGNANNALLSLNKLSTYSCYFLIISTNSEIKLEGFDQRPITKII